MEISVGRMHQLVAVARARSFSRAAIALNISQPALSRSVASIEAHYGFQIFDRLPHGVRPTALGAQTIAEVEPVLQSLRVLDANLRLYGAGEAGSLHLGLSPLLASEMLATFASAFFGSHSTAQLRVIVRAGPDLLDALKADEIELFFFPEGHIGPSPDLEIDVVGSVASCCVVRAGHPLAALSSIALDDLAGFSWASSIDTPGIGAFARGSRFICDNYHIVREAVLASDLVCICSRAFVAEQLADSSLRELRVEGLALSATEIHAARLRGAASSPLARGAVDYFRSRLAATI